MESSHLFHIFAGYCLLFVSMKIHLLVCLVTALLFLGCNSNSSEPTATDKLSYLNVGNKWTYSITEFNPDGSIERSWVDTMIIVGTTIINGKEYFRYDSTKFHTGSLQRVDDMGLWFWSTYSSTERLGIKYPSFEGEVWHRDTNTINFGPHANDKEYSSLEYLKNDTTITTEAGTFSCSITTEKSILASDGSVIGFDSIFVDPKYGMIKLLIHDNSSTEIRLIKHNLP